MLADPRCAPLASAAATSQATRPDPEHAARAAAAVRRALREIPHYAGVGAASDDEPLAALLARLPLLTKRAVRGRSLQGWLGPGRDLEQELGSGALELVETSGSTGDRLRVLWDAGWWAQQEARAMRTHPGCAAAMAREGYREAILTTPACGLGTCHVGDLPYEERVEGIALFLAQRADPRFWSESEQARMLDELGRHGAVCLEADPYSLATLCHFARARGRALDVGGFVQLTYAQATRTALAAIRAVYPGPLLQIYGASEVGVLFMEGEDGLLHHAPRTTHVELLPARVPTPGAEDVALVVATTLDRRAMPLLRLVLGDLVQVARAAPRRFTTVPALASVEGRVDDALVRPDGALVTAGALDRAIGAPPGLRLWQARQDVPGAVLVDVVCDGPAEPVVAGVRARLAALCAGLALEVRPATAIPIEPSGKLRASRRAFPLDLAASFEGA